MREGCTICDIRYNSVLFLSNIAQYRLKTNDPKFHERFSCSYFCLCVTFASRSIGTTQLYTVNRISYNEFYDGPYDTHTNEIRTNDLGTIHNIRCRYGRFRYDLRK